MMAFGFGWLGVYDAYGPPDFQREEAAAPTIDAVVERIIGVESHGDPNAKNKRSSATGLGQFLDETWLDMIRVHRCGGMPKLPVRSPRDLPSET